MSELLASLNCKICVDDIAWRGANDVDLLNTLNKILGHVEDASLFAATHKCSFFDTEILWCGKHLGGQLSHDFDHLSRLASMRRPQTTGELMQFFQTVRWLRTSLIGWQRLSSAFVCCCKSTWGEFSADQVSRVESGDRGGSMEARAGGCVKHCSEPGSQCRRFVTPEK